MDNNLYEMIDLIHVPEVNRRLPQIIDTWMEDLGKAAKERFDVGYKRYHDILFSNMQVPDTGPGGRPVLFWFELQRYDDWRRRMIKDLTVRTGL